MNEPPINPMTFTLTDPPADKNKRELWLQHAAGFILFHDMRKYAIERIPGHVDDKTRELVTKGIDDAVYGMMMIMDGVTGFLGNNDHEVSIESRICLKKDDEVVQALNTLDGDGMCMGYQGWKEGDFGEGEVCPAVIEQE